MDVNVERECSALGGLFHQIITDMKNGAPLWEDLISKATKLHACLKAAILAVSAYLEAFQKIADAATSARGATKEIGTALTRICLRHKAVETRMKSFTCAIMDRLVMPLQEKLEDWKKTLINLDKEHAKEYKKAKSELKKRSTDTLRLQKKKARKGIVPPPSHGSSGSSGGIHNHMSSVGAQPIRIDDAELNRLLETSAAVVHEKRVSLEETERKAVRSALLEERGRFCHLAKLLKPVLDEEIAMLMELTHLQEVSDQLERHASAPFDLPAASEQVITDLKGQECTTQWALATPPSSPSLSLGSRKSSMCSISSLTSSSSGSCKNHPSPCSHPWHRSLSQPLGTVTRSTSSITNESHGTIVKPLLRHLSTGSSRDSGFTSQDTLYRQPINENQVSNVSSQSNQSGPVANANLRQLANATWPDLQETTGQYNNQSGQQNTTVSERPHTISSAYEKGGLHQRSALSVYTFQPPDLTGCCHSQPASPVSTSNPQLARVQLRKNSAGTTARPPIPNRCSSLERPASTSGMSDATATHRGKPKLPIPAHLAKELGNHQLAQQPMYVNMHELASLAANRAQEMQIPAASGRASASSGSNNTGSGSIDNTTPIEKTELTAMSAEKLVNTNQIVDNSLEIASSCTLSRRGSMQQPIKPPPPTRRTSSIITTSSSGSFVDITVDSGLLTIASALADERTLETADASSAVADETENLPPPPAFLLEGNSPTTSPTPQRSISVSETVRTLTELRHTPASPSFLRKAVVQQAQTTPATTSTASVRSNSERSNSSRRISTASVEPHSSGSILTQGPSTISQGFMAVLSSKLAGNTNINTAIGGECSPKSSRKHINVVEQQMNINQRTPHGFLETLNAKLAAQKQQQRQSQQFQQHHVQVQVQVQQMPQQQNQPVKLTAVSRSASVRRIMANRVPIIDPLQVRDSLMDQIRRGTSLRKTSGAINDRSAPQIY